MQFLKEVFFLSSLDENANIVKFVECMGCVQQAHRCFSFIAQTPQANALAAVDFCSHGNLRDLLRSV